MGVKKSMDTFFAGLREQTMAGYGSKIVPTHMGPFKWNEVMQLWENVNNGMVLNNISFQDMFMMDYETVGGGDSISSTVNDPTLSGDWGVLTQVGALIMDGSETPYWSSTAGPQSLVINANAVTFTNVQENTTITLSINKSTGTLSVPTLRYNLNGISSTYSTPFTIAESDVLRIGVITPIFGGPDTVGGNIIVTVTQSGTVLDTIPYYVGAE